MEVDLSQNVHFRRHGPKMSTCTELIVTLNKPARPRFGTFTRPLPGLSMTFVGCRKRRFELIVD